MTGLGTIANCLGVIAGTTVGIIVKGGLPERLTKTVMQAIGIFTIAMGIGGIVAEFITVKNGSPETQHILLLLLCVVPGTILGSALDIDRQVDRFAEWCRVKMTAGPKKSSGSGGGADSSGADRTGAELAEADGAESASFSEGFITATFLFCVGAMAIIGGIQDGLYGDHSLLFTKTILDMISSMILAATFGKDIYVAVIPLGIYQGLITVLARFIKPWLTDMLIGEISGVGYVLILALGISLISDKKISLGNMMPSMFLPILYYALGHVIPVLATL